MHLPNITRCHAIATILLLSLTSPLYALPTNSLSPKDSIQAQTPQSRKSEADRLYDEGVDQYNNGKFQKALETYQKVLEIYRQTGTKEDIAKTLYTIGVIYIQLAQYPQAQDLLNKALVIYREIGDKESIGDTLNSLGAVANHLSQYQQALDFYRQALAISQQLQDSKGAALALNNIGGIYQSRSQYSQALKYYQQSLALQQKINEKSSIGHTLNSIASIYYEMGRYYQSLKFYQQALASVKTDKNLPDRGNILNNIGLVYTELGQYSKALEFYQQALAIRKEIGDKAGKGTTLNNIGFAYNQMKNHSQALEFYQQALKVFREIGNQANIGSSLNNIGFTYQKIGQYDKALESLQQGLTILQQVGDRAVVGRTLDSIGSVYQGLGKSAQALEAFQQALAISRGVGDRSTERIILSNIADVLVQQNKPQLAIIFYKQAVNTTEAIRKDLRSLSKEQQQSYTTTIVDTYRNLADLLLQEDRVLEAQKVLDLLKVQELEDYLQNVRGTAQTAKGVSFPPQEQKIKLGYNTILNQEVRLGKELAELEKISGEQRTAAQTQKIANLREQQQIVLKEFNKFIDSPEVISALEQFSRTARRQTVQLEELNSLQDNLKRLNQNAVLLYPLILDNRLELVLTTPYSPPIHRSVAVKRTDLNRAILNFLDALKDPEKDATIPGNQLYEWLIKPIEKDLAAAGAKTIIYAPDGQLRYIPLAALYDGKQWLVQRFRVNYITAFTLKELNTQPLPKIKVLAGATTERHIVQLESTPLPFKALQFAGAEVENLATIIPGTKTLLDSEFTRQTTIPYLNDYTIVHMATHAMFVNGKPDDSFILLGDSGLITLREIEDLSLPNVDLMVLSACETAVGDELGKGEEILGFGFQMQRTGAKAAIASLWAVSDGGTQALMNGFYAFLEQGKITKAEALRQAQLTMITSDYSGVQAQNRGIIKSTRASLPPKVANRLNHPYYWAPFILIGNGL